MNKSKLIILLSTSCFASSIALADTMTDIGDLTKPIISGDGNTVIGSAPGTGKDGSGSSVAQAYKYQNGVLTQLGTTYQTSYPQGLSSDGSTIVGKGVDSNENAFIYTNNGQNTFLSGPPNAQATAISANGNVVVGNSTTGSGFALNSPLFKYDVGGSVSYPQLTGGYSSTPGSNPINLGYYSNDLIYPGFDPDAVELLSKPPLFLSDDGSIIAGTYYYRTSRVKAFIFDNSGSGTFTSIGTLYEDEDYNSFTTGASGDGSTVVGFSSYYADFDNFQAFKYTRSSGIVGLGFLDGGITSYANAVSRDGSVVVGTSQVTGGNMHAFKHTDASGMQDLGTLGGSNSYAHDISADGEVIVGSSNISGDGATHAFSYYNGEMKDLGTLGGTNSFAYSVSDDGSVITGISQLAGDSTYHAFLYRQNLISIQNTQTTVAASASDTRSYMDLTNSNQSVMETYDCSTFGENKVCLSIGGQYGKAEDEFEQFSGFIATGYKITDTVRLGVFIDHGELSDNPSGFKEIDANPSIGSFVGYSQFDDGTGIQAKVTGSYNKNQIQITRSTMAYTEKGVGNSHIKSNMLSANLGYGFRINDKTILTPFLGMRRTKVAREAYTETNDNDVSFPIAYNQYSQRLTTSRFGGKINYLINNKLNINFSAAIEKDIESNFDSFSYYIPYHGSSNNTYTLADSTKYDCRGFGQLGIVYSLPYNQKIASDIIVQGQVNNKSDPSVNLLISYRLGL